MKKAAVMLMIMTVITSAVFFVPVNAATATTAVYKQTTVTNNGVSVTASACELYPTTDTSLYGGVKVGVLVSIAVKNTTDYTKGVSPFGLTLTANTAYIVDYENLSPDLNVAVSSSVSPYIAVVPSADYSYDNNIVVPPKTTLWMACVVYFRGEFNTQNNGVTGIGLSDIALTNFTVSTGDYPYGSGSAVDLSSIETLITELQYTGVMPGQLNPTVSSGQSAQYDYPDTGLHGSVYVYFNAPLRESYEVELNTNNDQPYQYGYVRYSGYLILHYWNSSDDQYAASSWLSMRNVLPNISGYRLFIDEMQANNVSSSQVYNTVNMDLVLTNKNFNVAYYPARCNEYVYIKFHYEIPINAWNDSTMRYSGTPSMSSFAGNSVTVDNEVYYPISDYFILRDLYLAINKEDDDVVDSSNDVNDDAAQVASQMQQVHQKEMQYFQDNQDAIAATGLNNFQFNQNHISAFTMITTQFTELWNALSDYTLVFIFTLLLSLATYIIKHEPTTKVKQYRSSVAAERAERISYYSKKNASARANNGARNDGDSYFWDAVRRNNT